MNVNSDYQAVQNITAAQQPQRTTRTEAAARTEKTSESAAVSRTENEYLQDLKDRYPKANISIRDVGSGSALQSYAAGRNGEFNDVAIHPDALTKFANDPTAAEFENALKSFLDSEQKHRQAGASNGVFTGGDNTKSGAELRAEALKKQKKKQK
jgi:hypothetical protein